MNIRTKSLRFPAKSIHLSICLAILTGSIGTLFAETHLDTLRRNFAEYRTGCFMHYGMNTFEQNGNTGSGTCAASVYNPTAINPAQWVSCGKLAKMKFMVLVCKHHDGFCNWDTKTTDYKCTNSTVNAAARKDVVKLFVDACHDSGIVPGLYLSVQDRNKGGDYRTTTSDPLSRSSVVNGRYSNTVVDFTMTQIKELIFNYGDIPFFVDDGWAWTMGHTVIPYQSLRDTLNKYSPNTLFSEHEGLFYPWHEDIIYFENSKGVMPPTNNIYASWLSNKTTGGNGWFYGSGSIGSLSTFLTTLVAKCDPYYCAAVPNLAPDTRGLFPDNYVTWCRDFGSQIGTYLTKNRAPLPTQPPHMEYVITAIGATSSSGTARLAIDGISDGGFDDHYTQSICTMTGSSPYITVDLGKSYAGMNICSYLPVQIARADATGDDSTGAITGYKISYSASSGGPFTDVTLRAGSNGTWAKNTVMKSAQFEPVTARYMRLTARATAGGSKAEISELDFGYDYPLATAPVRAEPRPIVPAIYQPSSVRMYTNLTGGQGMTGSPLTRMMYGTGEKVVYSLDGRMLYRSGASAPVLPGSISSKVLVYKTQRSTR